MNRDYIELLTLGRISAPSFSAEFPAQEIGTELNWGDLVFSDDVLAQIEDIKGWIEYNAALLNDLGMAKKIKPGYRALFHGSPGTGKTLTATLLGKYTGRKVFRIDLSTVVSKFIGETEKNLAALLTAPKTGNGSSFSTRPTPCSASARASRIPTTDMPTRRFPICCSGSRNSTA